VIADYGKLIPGDWCASISNYLVEMVGVYISRLEGSNSDFVGCN
jgi:hypothetical protein